MRSGECEDDVVALISYSEDETVCIHRCDCRTRRLLEGNEVWAWFGILCFEHQRMKRRSPELLEAYLDGLKKTHMIAIGN